MDYKDYLEEAKKYIGDTDNMKAYREYYEKAIANLNKSYNNSASEIENQYRADLNEASAQNKLQSKNIAQYMAARGLSRSGEAENEQINSNLSYNSTAAELAGEKYESLAKLEDEKNASLLSLEKNYADKEYENSESDYEKAKNIADENIQAERIKTEAENEEKLAKLKYDYEAEENEKERQYKSEQAEKERQYEEAKAEEKEAEEENNFKPSQTAASLAKQVVASYTESGKIETLLDKMKIKNYLEKLESEENIDADYLNELRLALGSMGYKEATKTQEEAFRLYSESKNYYDGIYQKTYDTYQKLGFTNAFSAEKAKNTAMVKRLQYCAAKNNNTYVFNALCNLLNVSNDVIRMYNKAQLASEIKKEDKVE